MYRLLARRFLSAEEGATAVEYTFVLALIVIGIFSSVQLFGWQSGGVWGNNDNVVRNVVNQATGGS